MGWDIRVIPQGTVDNNVGPDRSSGPKALDPNYCRQPTLWFQDLCLEVLTVQCNELPLFVARALPLLIIVAYLIQQQWVQLLTPVNFGCAATLYSFSLEIVIIYLLFWRQVTYDWTVILNQLINSLFSKPIRHIIVSQGSLYLHQCNFMTKLNHFHIQDFCLYKIKSSVTLYLSLNIILPVLF